jgi:hypothetical protein
LPVVVVVAVADDAAARLDLLVKTCLIVFLRIFVQEMRNANVVVTVESF